MKDEAGSKKLEARGEREDARCMMRDTGGEGF
jgi:hypothetical protein